MEKNKIKKSAAVFATTLIIIIVGVASFAYFGTFDVNLINNVAVNINAVSPGNASFVSSATQLNLQVPAANMSQTNAGSLAAVENAFLTVNLTGAPNLLTKCTYDIVYEYDENSNVYGYGETPVTSENEIDIGLAILDGTDEENIVPTNNGINYYSNVRTFNYFSGSNPTGNYDENDKWDSIRKRVLVRNASISSTGELTTQNWLIVMGYFNLSVSQEQLAGKAFTGKIYVENYDCKTVNSASMTILKNNGGKDVIEAKEEPDFSKAATAEDSGMYAAEDDYGTSYYFRGVVDNNWVQFGNYTSDVYNCSNEISQTDTGSCTKIASNGDNMYWRIVRINGDGSIRMIYSGVTAPSENTKNVINDNNVGTINWHNYTDVSSASPNYANSEIKTYSANWFEQTDLNTKNLVDRLFCNDTTSGSETGSINNYAGNDRIKNFTPSLICTQENDKYTVNNKNGNGLLTYPLGLLTTDEIMYAGASTDETVVTENFYLNSNKGFWTITPMLYSNKMNVFYTYNSTYLNTGGTLEINIYGYRPVINIDGNITLSGDGTWNNPYRIG